MTQTIGIAAYDATGPLAPWTFDRRAPGARDVQIDILFCGICHSDLHTVRGEWGPVTFPQVPGHEIVGRVAAVGAEVSGFTPGQLVGVGCMVDSCQHCSSCGQGLSTRRLWRWRGSGWLPASRRGRRCSDAHGRRWHG